MFQFHYTSDFFGLGTHLDPYSELERLGKEYCHTHLSELQKKYPKESTDNLSKYCFSSIYLRRVIKLGFGIREPHLTARIRRDINGIKVDWALGAVLHQILTAKQQLAQKVPPTTPASVADALQVDVSTNAAPPQPEIVKVIETPYTSIHRYPDLDSPGLPDRVSSGSYLMGVSILVCALIVTYKWRESRPKRGNLHPQDWNAPV